MTLLSSHSLLNKKLKKRSTLAIYMSSFPFAIKSVSNFQTSILLQSHFNPNIAAESADFEASLFQSHFPIAFNIVYFSQISFLLSVLFTTPDSLSDSAYNISKLCLFLLNSCSLNIHVLNFHIFLFSPNSTYLQVELFCTQHFYNYMHGDRPSESVNLYVT